MLQWSRAHSSPETQAGQVDSSRGTSFNGAGLIRARKPHVKRQGQKCTLLQWSRAHSSPETKKGEEIRIRIVASMEPGSFEPGNLCSTVGTLVFSGFNGAGLIRARKLPNFPCHARSCEASMEPGSFEPGNSMQAVKFFRGRSFNGAGLIRARKRNPKWIQFLP